MPEGGFILEINERAADIPKGAGAMLEHALAINNLIDSVFEPSRHAEGQDWYDRLPWIVEAKWFVRPDQKKNWVQADTTPALELTSPGTRPEIEVRLYDSDGDVVRTIAAEIAIWYDGYDRTDSALYVSPTTTLTVAEMTELLTDAVFGPGCQDSDPNPDRTNTDERQEFKMDAEYRAGEILENETTADLRRIARITQNGLSWRSNGPQTIAIRLEETTITVSTTTRDEQNEETRTFARSELATATAAL